MTLSQGEFEAIIQDQSKLIAADIVWRRSDVLRAMEFRVNINNEEGYPIFLRGWYNPDSGKLSYSIIHLFIATWAGFTALTWERNIATPTDSSLAKPTKTAGGRAPMTSGRILPTTSQSRGTIP